MLACPLPSRINPTMLACRLCSFVTRQERVKASGGRVLFRAGTHRVMGMLAMSRALGDHFLRPYVIADPEVMSFQRTGDDDLLLLATVRG